MSGLVSAAQIWNVVSNTFTNLLSPNDGDKVQNITLPKSSEAGVNKIIAVTAVQENDISLGYLDASLLKGDKGDQGDKGDKGDQGIQGDPGVPGVNGNGLTYVGSEVPLDAQTGDTWLEQTTLLEAPIKVLWQFIAPFWLSLVPQHETFGVNAITSNTTITVFPAFHTDGITLGTIPIAIQVWSRQSGGASDSNFWTITVSRKWVLNNALQTVVIATKQMKLPGNDGNVYKLDIDLNVDYTLQSGQWIEIALTRTGSPAALRLNGFIELYESRAATL